MVSIAMATYNGEAFLRDQMESILRQTIMPDQIVISDDHSSDSTMSIIKDYAEEYSEINWTLLQNEQNLGYIKNFLNAMRACSGDIVILCDQDDIWKENKIEKTIEYFMDPKVLSVHNDIDIVDTKGEIIKKSVLRYRHKKRRVSLDHFFRHLYYCGMSSAYRNSLTSGIMAVDPDKVPTHDWLVHAVALCKDGFYISSEVLADRRFHKDNVALNLSKTSRKGISQRIEVVDYYCKHYELLDELFQRFGINKEDCTFTNKILKTNQDRKEYLVNRSVIKAIQNVIHIKYYPTIRAFISDLFYLLNIF